jgi:hypothetical protein
LGSNNLSCFSLSGLLFFNFDLHSPATYMSRISLVRNGKIRKDFEIGKSRMRAWVDRRVALNDSLIAQVEMALLTVVMSLARNETDGGNKLEGQ